MLPKNNVVIYPFAKKMAAKVLLTEKLLENESGYFDNVYIKHTKRAIN